MTTTDVLQTALDLGYVYVWLAGDLPVLQHPQCSRHGETTYARRRRQGTCTMCGQPPAPGKTQCATHLQAARNRYYARTPRKDR